MKEDITLIGICLAVILLIPIGVIALVCIILVLCLLLVFDFIDWIRRENNK